MKAKKRTLKALCLFAAIIFLLPLFAMPALAAEDISSSVLSGQAICFNLEYDRILFEKEADARISPAAFTKLMSALLAYEYRAENGNVSVTVTEEMLSGASGPNMALKAGEVLPLDSLLGGMLVNNANDAALVIASLVSGSTSAFVERMNSHAKELGMESTYFANPTGVDSPLMYTTLRDVLLLCKTLYRINDFMALTSQEKITLPATNLTKDRVYTNKNALIPYSYVFDYCLTGARGMIAGGTNGAGYCVATTRGKENCNYLVLVSGGVDTSEKQNGTAITSYYDAKRLLEWAEKSYAVQKVADENEIICERKVTLASGHDHMILVTKSALSTLLPAEFTKSDSRFSVKIQTDLESFTAPIVRGQTYGTAEYSYDGNVIGTVELVAQTNISRSLWLSVWNAVVRFFSHGPAHIALILLCVFAVFYVLTLIAVVLIQNARRNHEKHLALRRMEEAENRRLRAVREAEKRIRSQKLHRAGNFFREGFRVLSGDTEIVPTNHKKAGKNAPAPPRGIARVPEKYRKNPSSAHPPQGQRAGAAPRSAQGEGQAGRTPPRPAGQRPSQQKQMQSGRSPAQQRQTQKSQAPAQKQKRR